MKIIHTADLHLGSKMEIRLDNKKATKRKNELLLSFENLIEKAVLYDAKVIIIAGDLFDVKDVNAKTKDYLLGLFTKHSNIDFIYVSGNHDEVNFLSQIELPSNVKMCSNEWTTYNYDDVEITGINYNSYTDKFLYDTLNIDHNKKNIVVLHGQVATSNQPDIINLKKLANKGIDYLALGHIHSYKIDKLDDRGIYAYSGCLEGRGFDEIGEKGFLLIDTEDIKKPKFIPNSKRIIHQLDIDITNYNNWLDIDRLIDDRIKSISSNDMVLIKLTGQYDVSLIKQTEILSQKLNENFFFAKIKDESKLLINIDDYKSEISLKAEFIRNVINSDLKDIEKERVIEYGLKALIGEEL